MIYYTQRCLLVSLLLLIGLSATTAQSKNFTLQVEAMDSLSPALDLIQHLKSSGVNGAYYLKSEVPGKGVFYRVRVGNFNDPAAAQQSGENLRRARLIKEYYVARYEGGTYQTSSTPTMVMTANSGYANLPKKGLATRPIAVTEFVDNEPVVEETEVDVPPSLAPDKPRVSRPQPARTRQVIVRQTIRQSGVETGLGDVRIRVPFENDDLGSCFLMPTGSVMTAATSMGVFTARDQALGAVIPYAGLEAKLKFQANAHQGWTPPRGVVAADLMKMEINRAAGYREFYTSAPTLSTFGITGGKIIFQGLTSGEYMIRARTSGNKCVFLPLSVREDCCTPEAK